jgi:hypothetical protein
LCFWLLLRWALPRVWEMRSIHIEMHQFESEPQMSRAVWVSTLTAMPVMLSYSGNWFTTK